MLVDDLANLPHQFETALLTVFVPSRGAAIHLSGGALRVDGETALPSNGFHATEGIRYLNVLAESPYEPKEKKWPTMP